MTRDELIEMISSDANITRYQARDALDAYVNHTRAAIASGETVALRGFGVFSTRIAPAHAGRNPQTGAPIEIPAQARVKFKPAAQFVELLAPLAAAPAADRKAA